MTLTPEQTLKLNVLRKEVGYEREPTNYDKNYTPEQVLKLMDSSLQGVFYWVALHDHITAPDFAAKQAAAEAERLAKLAKSIEKNRDQIMRSWILNLSNTAYRAYPDVGVEINSKETSTSLKIVNPEYRDSNMYLLSITYNKSTNKLRTFIYGRFDLSEDVTTVHGSASPYTLFKGFAAIKDHFDKRIAGAAE